jgi:hypothetical protein
MNRPCEPPPIGRRDSDLMNGGGGQLAFASDPWTSPIDSMFSFCSYKAIKRECIGTFKKIESETAVLLKRRPLRRAGAMCALVANTYLEA